MGRSIRGRRGRRDAFGVGLTTLLAAALVLPVPAAAAPTPLTQIGSTGTGAGQLDFPVGIAVGSSGSLYVADTFNHRISVFNAGGTFIHAFGFGVDDGTVAFQVCTATSTCQVGIAGGGAGQLNTPRGVAVDGSGNLYVADAGNSRISVFNPAAPSLIRAFGWDVAEPDGGTAFEVCPGGGACREGDLGTGGGQLNGPRGVTLDASGNLYVADDNHRISVFNAAGPSFTRAFGWDVAEPDGGTAFEVCPTQGACRIGDPGGGGGQLNAPRGVALDGSGNLYVGDQTNHRVSVFNPATPSFIRAFGWDVAAPDGNLAFEVCPTQGACRLGDAGSGGGQLNFPFGVVVNSSGDLYVGDASNNRVSVFDPATPSFTHAFGWDVAEPDGDLAFELCPTLGACRIGDIGSGAGQFSGATGVAADCRGAVWVTDTGNDRLQRFGEPGTALPPCPAVGPSNPPATTPTTAATFDLATAIKKCKKKFPKGKKRKKCIKRAKQKAAAQ